MKFSRFILALLTFILGAVPGRAQQPPSGFTKPALHAEGYADINDYIAKNLHEPAEAIAHHIEGTVMVMVLVDTSGNLSDVINVNDLGYGCGDEAVRVIKSMPRLSPAIKDSQPVRMHMQIGVLFNIQKEVTRDSLAKLDSLNLLKPDQEAQFPGGEAAMMRYISENFKLPAGAEYQGTIYVSTDIDANGNLSNLQMVKKNLPSLDDEAIRVIKSMPRWVPAYRERIPVASSRVIPIQINEK